MKIVIQGVRYQDYGADAGVKTILEMLGFGVNEIGRTAFDTVLYAEIYSSPLNSDSATLIGNVVRDFGESVGGQWTLTIARPTAPNASTPKRIKELLTHLLVD